MTGIIQRITSALRPKRDAVGEGKWSQKELERLVGFKTERMTTVNRAQRRALGMTRAFTARGGRSGWIVNPGYRALAAEERERGNGPSGE